MTDKGIIKALECCSKTKCKDCPYNKNEKVDIFDITCSINMSKDALDLIKHQKSRIKELEKAYLKYEETSGLKWARAEVAREIFAEIERNIQAKINSMPFDEWEDGYFIGARGTLIRILHEITELKNKYTKEGVGE